VEGSSEGPMEGIAQIEGKGTRAMWRTRGMRRRPAAGNPRLGQTRPSPKSL
jgi:hypothetical protein